MNNKKFVDWPMGSIAYSESGDPERPPCLFIHGFPTSSYLWRDVIPALCDSFHCLAPDLMGFGDTRVDERGEDFSIPGQARMLLDFLDEKGIERVNVIGHDQGGGIAQYLAVYSGSRIRRLVLTNSIAFDNWPVREARRLARLMSIPGLPTLLFSCRLLEFIERTRRRGGLRGNLHRKNRFHPDVASEYFRPMATSRQRLKNFLAYLRSMDNLYTQSLVPGLRQLRIPTLVLWAELDRLLPVRWGHQLAELIPESQFHTIAETGHFWPEENVEGFTVVIRRFLEESS